MSNDFITLRGNTYQISIKKSKIAKRITFRYYDNVIHITAPYLTTKKYIIKTLSNLENDIIRLVEKSHKREINFNCYEEIYFFGREYMIFYGSSPKIDGNKIYLKKEDPKNSYLSLAKKFGLGILQDRVNYYLSIIDPKLELKELKIRNMVSRYGDCYPSRKSITLNLKLAYYTLPEIDSVIVHELIHLIHQNHSKDFYQKVLEYCPNYYELKRNMDEVNLR